MQGENGRGETGKVKVRGPEKGDGVYQEKGKEKKGGR